MELTWQQWGDVCRGFSDGVELVQVAHVFGPDGADRGWLVWLVQEQGELFDHYPTPGEGMAAAEAWLDTLAQPSITEDGERCPVVVVEPGPTTCLPGAARMVAAGLRGKETGGELGRLARCRCPESGR